MRFLVFGSTGQLAREIVARALSLDLDCRALGRAEVDVTRSEEIWNAMDRLAPSCLINATAYTAVDKAESEPDIAFAVNKQGPRMMAEVCAARRIPLVHVSTDYVFDGEKSAPYVEVDPINPLNVYGASKGAGEVEIRKICERHIIVRTAWVYSRYGNNFLKTMIRLAANRDSWDVVADQLGMPTAATDLASAVIVAAMRACEGAAPWGTYHFAGSEEATWHQFASEILDEQARYTGRRPSIAKIPTDQYPTPARRPRNSRLDSSLFSSTFGVRSEPRSVRIREIVHALCS